MSDLTALAALARTIARVRERVAVARVKGNLEPQTAEGLLELLLEELNHEMRPERTLT